MQKEGKIYHPTIDILRTLAILAVVLIHTTTITLQTSANNLTDFSFTLFLNQTARFAVPLFFIISGYLLELNYDFQTNFLTYFKKRVVRIIIPYIAWSFYYYFFVFKIHFESFYWALIKGEASYQLYFIPALFIFYIFFPILHKFAKYYSNWFILTILASIQLIPIYNDYFVKPITFFHPLAIVVLNYFYFLFGIVAARNKSGFEKIISKWVLIITPLTIVSAGYIFYEGLNRYLRSGNYLDFYSQWRPSVFVFSLSLASILLYLLKDVRMARLKVKSLANLSFFVYFCHTAILEMAKTTLVPQMYALLSTNAIGRVLIDPLLFIFVISVSFILSYIIHKIPHLSKITG